MTLLCTPGWVCSSGTSVRANFGESAAGCLSELQNKECHMRLPSMSLRVRDATRCPDNAQNVYVLSAVSQRKEEEEEKLMFSGLKEKWKPNSNLF